MEFKEFEVEVVDEKPVDEGFVLKLKETPFYPDGKGGQLGDRGTIGNARVLKVIEENGETLHLVDKSVGTGKHIARIDMARRKDIAQQHTGQHILSAAFVETSNIPTVGFHMGEEYSTIDLDVPVLTNEALRAALELANEIVRSCIDVETLEVKPEELDHYHLRKSVDEKILESTKSIRLIKIGDFDVSACGGFHVENTGMVGTISVIKTEKIKKTQTRVYFLAGKRTERHLQKLNDIVGRLTTSLTCSIDELTSRAETFLEELKTARSLTKKLSEKLAQKIAASEEFEKLDNIAFIFWQDEPEVAAFLPKYLKNYFLVSKTENGFMLASDTLNCSKIVEMLKSAGAVKGGGAGQRRGQIVSDLPPEQFIGLVKKVIKDESTAT